MTMSPNNNAIHNHNSNQAARGPHQGVMPGGSVMMSPMGMSPMSPMACTAATPWATPTAW